MKRIIQYLLILLPFGVFAQKTETNTQFLSGKIDKFPIEMIFETTTFTDWEDQLQTVYNIRYYYLSQLRPINLWGQKHGDSVIFSNENDFGASVETFRGKWAGDHFVGIWEQDDKKLPFQLKVVQPTVPMHTLKKEEQLKDEQAERVVAVYSADLSMPVDKSLEEQFVRAISGGALGDIDKMIAAEASSFLADFYIQHDGESTSNDDTPEYQFEYGSVSYPLINSKEYLILAHSHYQYTGGAHGMYHVTFYNYSHKQGRILKLTDVLETKSEQAIADIIEKEIRKKHKIPEGIKLTEAEETIFINDQVTMSDNFVLSKNGITFYYGLYDMTPYVFGMFEIFVPFEQLKPYLKQF